LNQQSEDVEAFGYDLQAKALRGEPLPSDKELRARMNDLLRGGSTKVPPTATARHGGGDMNVSFDPVVITIKSERREALQTSTSASRVATRSEVSE
jgi:hypothetical protein